MIDWRGTEIKEDSIIVYPGRRSSHMWMIEARVLEITSIDSVYSGDSKPALKVQPLRQGNGRTDMKPVTLTALEKVTVIQNCRDAKSLTDEEIIESLIGSGM